MRAEAYSPRFGRLIIQALGDKSLVYSPDLSDHEANARRRFALAAVRGYGRNQYLFGGFPDGVQWKLVAVSIRELAAFRYASHETWNTLSQGSRLLADRATNVEVVPAAEDANTNIRAVERAVRRGQKHPPIIAVATDPSSPRVGR